MSFLMLPPPPHKVDVSRVINICPILVSFQRRNEFFHAFCITFCILLLSWPDNLSLSFSFLSTVNHHFVFLCGGMEILYYDGLLVWQIMWQFWFNNMLSLTIIAQHNWVAIPCNWSRFTINLLQEIGRLRWTIVVIGRSTLSFSRH